MDDSQHFDLVVSEQFYRDSWRFGHKFETPVITINSFATTDFTDYANGLVTPLAHHMYHTYYYVHYDDGMTF